MTYAAPELTLVGTAGSVVMAKIVNPHYDGLSVPEPFDSAAFVEAEW